MSDIELLDDATHAAVVRLPGRAYPGIVVHGDTLKELSDLALEVAAGIDPKSDAAEAAVQLRDLLLERVQHYEAVLEKRGLSFPFA